MNRKQQKHEMMITFLSHAKETKKKKAKKRQLISFSKESKKLFLSAQKMWANLSERFSTLSRHFSDIYMQWRGKYKLLSLLKNKR